MLLDTILLVDAQFELLPLHYVQDPECSRVEDSKQSKLRLISRYIDVVQIATSDSMVRWNGSNQLPAIVHCAALVHNDNAPSMTRV